MDVCIKLPPAQLCMACRDQSMAFGFTSLDCKCSKRLRGFVGIKQSAATKTVISGSADRVCRCVRNRGRAAGTVSTQGWGNPATCKSSRGAAQIASACGTITCIDQEHTDTDISCVVCKAGCQGFDTVQLTSPCKAPPPADSGAVLDFAFLSSCIFNSVTCWHIFGMSEIDQVHDGAPCSSMRIYNHHRC